MKKTKLIEFNKMNKFRKRLKKNELEDYDAMCEIIGYNLDSTLSNLNYENHVKFKEIISSNEERKADLKESGKYFAVTGISIIAFALLSTMSLWWLLALPFTLLPNAYLAFISLRQNRTSIINNFYYRLLKNKGKIDKVKECLFTYERSINFNSDKINYEISQTESKIDTTINEASNDIRLLEHTRNLLKSKNADETYVVITTENGEQTICDSFGNALPLIARMIAKNQKFNVSSSNEPTTGFSSELPLTK